MLTAGLLTVSHSVQEGRVSAGIGGVCLGGVCLGGESQHAMGQAPPTVDRMTDRQV